MPGTGIIDFAAHARAIARAGIYDFQVHHEQVLVPVVLNHWEIEPLTTSPQPRRRHAPPSLKRIDRIGRAGRRFARNRAEATRAGRRRRGLTGARPLTRTSCANGPKVDRLRSTFTQCCSVRGEARPR